MTTAEDYGSPSDERHLAALLLSPYGRVYLSDVLEQVSPSDFADPAYGWMWAAGRVIAERGDPITKRTLTALRDVVAPAKLPGQPGKPGQVVPGLPLNAPSGRSLDVRLTSLVGEPIYTTRLAGSIRAVRDAGQLRRLIEAVDAAKAAALTAPDYSSALESVHGALNGLDGSCAPAEVVRFADLVNDFNEWQTTEPRPGEIIPTPWPELNKLLNGGFRAGQLVVVAGRPGSGKSNAGLALAVNAAESGRPALVVSQEMSNLELTGRVMASGARVEYSQITKRSLDGYSFDAVQRYAEKYRDMPLWMIDKPGVTVEYAGAVSRSMRRIHGLDIGVFDYVQLLEPTDVRMPRNQQVSHISRKLKLLAQELQCVIVMLSQLNRENVRDGRKPGLADLRDSGSLEQDPDVAILLHHEDDKDGNPSGHVKAILAKHRSGPTGEVDLRWHGHQARIGD